MTVTPIPRFPAYCDLPRGHVSGPQLCVATGITYRQLDYWTRVGYLKPININPGTGYLRAYPADEVAHARLMADLLRSGLTPAAANEHARRLAETGRTVIGGITVDLPEPL